MLVAPVPAAPEIGTVARGWCGERGIPVATSGRGNLLSVRFEHCMKHEPDVPILAQIAARLRAYPPDPAQPESGQREAAVLLR